MYGPVASRPIATPPPLDVLVVCTGNIARSAMAEALLRRHLAARAPSARVRSAGLLQWAGSPPPPVLEVMRDYGLDLSAHRSRQLTAALIADADLVLGMTRDHVWGVLARDPAAVGKAFLLVELARLGGEVGPRAPHEPLAAWAARVAARRPSEGPPGRGDDEIADPLNESADVYRATAARLDAATTTIAELVAPL